MGGIMLAMANRISDKALSVLLRRAEAGACVPPDICGCIGGWYYKYNCYGSCVKSVTKC
jgi:hypothetical protein